MVRDLKTPLAKIPDLNAIADKTLTESDIVFAAVRYAHLTLVEDKPADGPK
jgi:hypothetical protein